MPRRLAAAAIAALLAAALGACGLEQDIASKSLSAGPGGGQPAPGLHAGLVDGGSFDLAAQRGRPVVVDFFASWCGPCHQQQGALNTVAARYAGRVVMVGVDLQESAAEVHGYESTESVPYGAVIDGDGSIAAAYNVPAPPVTVVVDRSGVIAQTFFGNVTAARLAAALDPLLVQGTPATGS